MDIKILLLKSLSVKKPISGSHRIYYGKSCFVIKYVINGKVLSIKSIKNQRKRITWSQRIKYYMRASKINRSMNFSTATSRNFDHKETMTEDFNFKTKDAQREALNIPITIKKTAAKTIDVLKHSKEVQTETLNILPNIDKITTLGLTTNVSSIQKNPVSFTSTAQQTIASVKFNRNIASLNQQTTLRKHSKSSQTDSNTECKGIQCKRSTQTKASNTDVNTRDSFTQVQSDLLDVGSPQEEAAKCLALPRKDFEVFIYMLNEIGETVMKQNRILNNNTETMQQIMQINVMKDSKRMNRSCRSISTQTDELLRIETKNNFSQTKINYTKPRKLLLFRGRNSRT